MDRKELDYPVVEMPERFYTDDSTVSTKIFTGSCGERSIIGRG